MTRCFTAAPSRSVLMTPQPVFRSIGITVCWLIQSSNNRRSNFVSLPILTNGIRRCETIVYNVWRDNPVYSAVSSIERNRRRLVGDVVMSRSPRWPFSVSLASCPLMQQVDGPCDTATTHSFLYDTSALLFSNNTRNLSTWPGLP